MISGSSANRSMDKSINDATRATVTSTASTKSINDKMYKLFVIILTLNSLIISVQLSQTHHNHRNRVSASDERQSNSNSNNEKVIINHKNCTRCSLVHEDAKNRRIEQFKREFLHKLGLKEAPKIDNIDKSLYKIPPLLHSFEMLNSQSAKSDNNLAADEMMLGDQPFTRSPPADDLANDIDDSSTIKKIISFAKSPPGALNVSNEWNAQYFDFSPSLLNLYISRATLWINVRKPSDDDESDDDDDEETQDKYPSSDGNGASDIHTSPAQRGKAKSGGDYGWIVIDRVRSYPLDDGASGQSLFHVHSRRVHITSGSSWVKLRVKKLVNQLIHEPKENLGLVIHVYDSEGRILPIGSAGSVKYKSLQVPFIEMRTDQQIQSRFKRRTGDGQCDINKSDNQRCCLYPFTVDFRSFGWKWILAPESYQANYCTGECHRTESVEYMHIIAQAGRPFPLSSCCVAKKMSPLQIIYVTDKGDIETQLISDMRIDRCGCA